MALVYGDEPLTPTHPDSGLYVVLDWIGDWNEIQDKDGMLLELIQELEIIL